MDDAVKGADMDEAETYVVVVNDEEQHALWPSFRTVPDGWQAICPPLSKQECLDVVERQWTDIRPLSLRRALAADE
jgi:MbtH protein